MNEEVRVRFSAVAKRKIYSATAMATLMALIVGQAKAAFLLAVLILPLSVWMAYSLYVILLQPYARLAQTICVSAWAGALGIVLLIHYVRHESAREDAEEIVKAIVQDTTSKKHCPADLNNLVVQRPLLTEKLRADFSYSCINGKPRFFYSATFTVFDTYDYDFRTRSWKYRTWLEKGKTAVSSGESNCAAPGCSK